MPTRARQLVSSILYAGHCVPSASTHTASALRGAVTVTTTSSPGWIVRLRTLIESAWAVAAVVAQATSAATSAPPAARLPAAARVGHNRHLDIQRSTIAQQSDSRGGADLRVGDKPIELRRIVHAR